MWRRHTELLESTPTEIKVVTIWMGVLAYVCCRPRSVGRPLAGLYRHSQHLLPNVVSSWLRTRDRVSGHLPNRNS